MRKLILFGAMAVSFSVGGVVLAEGSYSSCNYNEKGQYISPDGRVSAVGTMNAAMDCAANGELPDIVAHRLGVFGDSETKAWAEDIKKLNEEVKERKKKAVTEEVLEDPDVNEK